MNRKILRVINSAQILSMPVKIINTPLHQLNGIHTVVSSRNYRICFSDTKGFLVNATQSNRSKLVTYTDVKKIVNEKQPDEYLIDVREPEELRDTGIIPGSVNVPLDQLKVAFKELSNEEFQKKYGNKKPQKDSLVIFSCKSGVRSSKAQALAEQLGYKKSKSYSGGWLDWEEHLKK